MAVAAGFDRAGLLARARPLLTWVWVIVAVIAWLPGVSTQALIDPDEGRNASIALEMARGGNPLAPQLNGLPFLDKPFLFFWLQALAIRALGATELAARLPSIAASVLLVALVGRFARRVWGERVAWIAAFALATSLLTMAFARVASFDAVLTLTTSASAMAFFLALGASRASPPAGGERAARELFLTVAWAVMAVGVMVKGPVALLLPVATVQTFAWIRGDGASPWSIRGVGVFAALLAVWLLLTERASPGFLRYALLEESWKRVTTDQYARTGPIWYFIPILVVGAVPWILGALPALRTAFRRGDDELGSTRFLAIWLLLPLVLFSLSHSKRPQYALPLVPALALLAGVGLAVEQQRAAFVRGVALLWLVAGAATIVAGAARTPANDLAFRLTPGLAARFSLTFGSTCLAAAALAWVLRRRPRPSLVAAALPVLLLPLLARPLIAEVSEDRSGRQVAAAVAPFVDGGREIVGINTFVPSLPFYRGGPVRLSAGTLDELTSRSMLHFAGDIARRAPASWVSDAWWRESLARNSAGYVFLIKPNRASEIAELERAGLVRLFTSAKVLAYVRFDPVASVASAAASDDRPRRKRRRSARGTGG